MNYTLCPFLSSIRSIAEVLRRIFFFPSGVSVERQVRHVLPPGGDVMHAMSGTLEEVPVPRKINSIPSTAGFDCSITAMIAGNRGKGDNQISHCLSGTKLHIHSGYSTESQKHSTIFC